ncbi:MAG: hypothetical protein Q9168_005180 [Polycauliona sp. 1 TL-2023]
MSYTSSYTETCALAAQVRAKFLGEYGAGKDQNLRLIVAHAQLYDCLNHHIENLEKIRQCNASGKNPYAPPPVVAVPDHQDPFRMNQQANPPRKRPTPQSETPFTPPLPATEYATDANQDPRPPSKTSNPTCSVTIQEIEEIEEIDHEDPTSSPHTPPQFDGTPFTMMTEKSTSSTDPTSPLGIPEASIDDPSDSESDSDSDSDSNSDFDFDSGGESVSSNSSINSSIDSSIYSGDLDPDLSFSTMKAVPAPILKPNTSQRCIKWQDREPSDDQRLKLSDVIPHEHDPQAIKIGESLPTLQRCGPSTDAAARPAKEASMVEPEPQPNRNPAPAAVAAPSKTSPLAPQLCDDASDVSAEVHQNHGLLQKCLRRLVDGQNNGVDTLAISPTIARSIPSLAFWNFGSGEKKTRSR